MNILIDKDSHIGSQLRQLREQKGMFQNQVAEILGKKRPYISYIEAKKFPSTPMIMAYCKAIGVDFHIRFK